MPEADDLAAEQDFISVLYRRLDRMREETIRLRDTYLRDSDGTPGGRVQRDIAYAGHARTLIDLNIAEDRLCFGRLDYLDGDFMHVDTHVDELGPRRAVVVGPQHAANVHVHEK